MMVALSLVVKATVILVAALLANRLIRRTGASTRALILTSAVGALLVLPLLQVVLPSRAIEVELPRIPSVLESVVAPLANVSIPAPQVVNSRVRPLAPEPSRLPQPATIVWVIWSIGASFLLARLGAGLVRLRVLRQTGERWGDSVAATILQQATSRRVNLFLHRDLTAPMTCGIARPAIGLPVEARDWSTTELRQALIHEVEHIRRADWLVLVLSKVACSLYWFHPLTWIAAQRLHLECEYACDDAVVRVGGRASYAQQLVSMARRLSESVSRPALSMADRRDLAKRVDAVLTHDRPRTQLRPHTAAATTIAALLFTAAIAPWRPAAAQSDGGIEDVLPIPTALTGKAFSQVSIGPGDATGSPTAWFNTKTGVFTARNTTLLGLISEAYAAVPRMEPVDWEPFGVNDQRITSGPEWMETERFQITAKANPRVTAEELQAMLRRLLRDSFDLSVRDETRQTPAYRMVRIGTAGSSAPGLQPGNQSCADRWNMEGGGPGHIVRRCITFAELAADFTLTEVLGRPVIDRTGISGVFNLSLVHAPTPDELSTIYKLSPSDLPREFFNRPSIFTAMEQQLGVRLESTQGRVHTLAIDSAARPTRIR